MLLSTFGTGEYNYSRLFIIIIIIIIINIVEHITF